MNPPGIDVRTHPAQLLSVLQQPIAEEKRRLIQQKWLQLPASLRTDNQVVGRHWVHCGYTMGPAYCSFGCSHCYLPRGANRTPMVTLAQMREQILAQRRLLGPGGNLQITGGDVVDAYWRAGRPEELIAILAFAVSNELVPMLMTHGQILLEHPQYLDRLVLEGGLRKLSIHIDITMAGRPGYPVRTLERESQLNPLRDRFVELVLGCRRRTGKTLVAAQTVTVTGRNVDSIGDVLDWNMSRVENMDVCRTISFQTEAAVGRTRINHAPVSPEIVWERISQAVGHSLARDHLLFGHPDCSSVATVLARPGHPATVCLESRSRVGRKFWSVLLDTFGGMEASSTNPGLALLQKLSILVRKPAIIPCSIAYGWQLMRRGGLGAGFIAALLTRRARGFNIVMHNFMSGAEIRGPRCQRVRDRLEACAFRGVIRSGNEWQVVSMCEMNADLRPELYRAARREQAATSKP